MSYLPTSIYSNIIEFSTADYEQNFKKIKVRQTEKMKNILARTYSTLWSVYKITTRSNKRHTQKTKINLQTTERFKDTHEGRYDTTHTQINFRFATYDFFV